MFSAPASDEWTVEAAEAVAAEEEIVMTLDHWRVIWCWRELTLIHGAAPALEEMEAYCGISAAEVRKLFPGQTLALVTRIAGLPE